jgi:hypothetical protein
MVLGDCTRVPAEFQICKWVYGDPANPENVCFRLSDNFVKDQRKNYHGRASTLWLSHEIGPNRSLWFLASVLKIANLNAPQHLVVGLNKPLMVGS